MDEASSERDDHAEAAERLALMQAIAASYVRCEVVYLDGLSMGIEADLRSLRRFKWIMRGAALWNIAAGCWCLLLWPGWVAWLVPVSVWSTYKALRLSQGTDADVKTLEARWQAVREKIKQIDRMASNES